MTPTLLNNRILVLALLTGACTAAVCTMSCARPAASRTSQHMITLDSAAVRRELQQRYDENRKAFLDRNVEEVMRLRTPDFHTIGADGQLRDRAAMRHYTEGIINGVDRWIDLAFHIDSLTVANGEAVAIVRHFLDRMALREDGKIHHVQTWVTQRETWKRTTDGWKMWRVDQVRNQRRLIDGKP